MRSYTSSDYTRDKQALLNNEAYRRVIAYELRAITKTLAKQVDDRATAVSQGELKYLLGKDKDIEAHLSKAVSS